MNFNNPTAVITIIIGTFLIVLTAVGGLVLLAINQPSVIQIIIPILAGVVSGFVTGGVAVVTHFVSGQQEQQRIILNGAAKTNLKEPSS